MVVCHVSVTQKPKSPQTPDGMWRDLRGSNPSENFAILRKYASPCVLLRTLLLRDAQENAQT